MNIQKLFGLFCCGTYYVVVYSGSSLEYRREMTFFKKKNSLICRVLFLSFSVGFILIFVFVVDDAAAAAE